MPVIVVRVADMPTSVVPSRVVQCTGCGADCWLSLATGDSTLALSAHLSGDHRIWCAQCLQEAVAVAGGIRQSMDAALREQAYCPHYPPCTPYPCSVVRQVTE